MSQTNKKNKTFKDPAKPALKKKSSQTRTLHKMGIFGASFNPLHLGHLSLLIQVQKKFNFDLIKVLPASRAPLSLPVPGLSPQKKLAHLQESLKEYSFAEVDDREIKRGGISYTIDTIEALEKDFPKFKEFFLIIGMDQWARFDKWKNFKAIIEKAHLVICSRKGYKWSASLPPLLKKYISEKSLDDYKIKLTTGKNIYYQPLNDINISSSQVRLRASQGLPISHLVPPVVDEWVQTEKPYKAPVVDHQTEKPYKESPEEGVVTGYLQFCVDILLDKKARRVKTFDLTGFHQLPFDFTLVASGLNTRHTKALALYLRKELRKNFSLSVQHIEGLAGGEWIVLDYGFLVVHIFYDYTREHYRLEDLWKSGMQKCFRNDE